MTMVAPETVTLAMLEAASVQRTLYPLARALGVPSYAALAKPALCAAILACGAERVAAALDGIGGAAPAAAPAATAAPARDIAAAIQAAIAAAMASLPPPTASVDEDAVHAIVTDRLAGLADELRAELARAAVRRVTVVERPGAAPVDVGTQHERFPALLAVCSARGADGHRLVAWLHGPAGTGKTTAARAVAQALGLSFAFTGALDGAYGLLGFVDAGGRVIRTPFREAWETGGVFLFDEVDASHPSAVVAFNAALANGVCAFPDATVSRHPDCVIIAAANTTGHGGAGQYVGRVRQDAATLDRFVMLEWPIDEALESAMSRDSRWLAAVRAVRAHYMSRRVDALITPRAVVKGDALLAIGIAFDDVAELVLRCGVTQEVWDGACTAAKTAWGSA